MEHGIIDVDGLFHLFQGTGIHIGSAGDGAYLMAHIVTFSIDQVDGVAGNPILLLILHPYLGVDFHLVFQIALEQQIKLYR